MPNPKYKIGQAIKIKATDDKYIFGHVVVIISTEIGLEYYCSMYPGAMSNYYWVYCADLGMQLLYDGEVNTLQALNKFTEDQLEYSDEQKIRKFKLKKIQESKIE
jgi:hypothetical protein